MTGIGPLLPRWIKPDVWLDERHAIQFVASDGQRSGALFCHRKSGKADGDWCIGGFQWAGSGPLWTLVSIEPLHVEPSVHCLTCGEHGFIRDGKWIAV